MNSSAINSIPFNHSSSGFGLLSVNEGCIPPDYGFVIVYTVFLINFFMGYPANIMVLWLVARKEIDSSTSDVFFVNLAIFDVIYCLITPLNYLIIILFNQGVNMYIMNMIFGIKDTSPLFLTCICLDRYVAVVHPIVFTSIKDKKIKVPISMLVWLFMITYGFMRRWMGYNFGILFTAMILTISIIMVFCNIRIMRSLRKSVLGKEKISPMKKKAQRTVQFTLAIIVFHYLPLAAIKPFVYLIEYQTICIIEFMAYNIMHLSCSIEPLLCISKVKQLSCLNNFPCICCQSPSPEPHNVST